MPPVAQWGLEPAVAERNAPRLPESFWQARTAVTRRRPTVPSPWCVRHRVTTARHTPQGFDGTLRAPNQPASLERSALDAAKARRALEEAQVVSRHVVSLVVSRHAPARPRTPCIPLPMHRCDTAAM